MKAVVDVRNKGSRISKHIYGHFSEHLGRCIYGGYWVGEDSPILNMNGICTDIVQAMKAMSTKGRMISGEVMAHNTFDNPDTVHVAKIGDIHVVNVKAALNLPACAIAAIEVEAEECFL